MKKKPVDLSKISSEGLINVYKRMIKSGDAAAIDWNYCRHAVSNGMAVPINMDVLLTLEEIDHKRYIVEAKKRIKQMDFYYNLLGRNYSAK